MPIYTYRCTNCGKIFEVNQSMQAKDPTTCEKCGGKLKKVFGNVGVVFKGSGFYRTDSRANSSKGSDSSPD